MAGAICGEPDPNDATNEPCILAAGHGAAVPHLWTGYGCRHFAIKVTALADICMICGATVPRNE